MADAAIRLVFGDSDSEDAGDSPGGQVHRDLGISGLTLAKSLLSQREQSALLGNIAAEGWLQGAANQAMAFGNLHAWTYNVAAKLPDGFFPNEIAARRPLFDQLAANHYQPGEGLKAHVDLPRFADGICILSLGSAAVMRFTPASTAALDSCQPLSSSHALWEGSQELAVLLEPGDALGLSGPARWEWFHGIEAAELDCWRGKWLERGTRTSLTLRRLRPDTEDEPG